MFNPDFTFKTQFPPQSRPESTPFPGKNLSQKSPLKVQKQSESPPSVLLRQAPGPRIRKRGSVAGPGSKIRAKVARIRVPSPYPAKDGRIRTPVFSLSLTFLLMPLDCEKERCKAKAKGLDVFFWVGLSFSILVWPFSFLYQWPGSRFGPVPTYVVSRSRLVITQSGSDPAARHGSVPRTDAI